MATLAKKRKKAPFTIARERLDKLVFPNISSVANILAQVPRLHKRALKNGQWFQDLCGEVTSHLKQEQLCTNRALHVIVKRVGQEYTYDHYPMP